MTSSATLAAAGPSIVLSTFPAPLHCPIPGREWLPEAAMPEQRLAHHIRAAAALAAHMIGSNQDPLACLNGEAIEIFGKAPCCQGLSFERELESLTERGLVKRTKPGHMKLTLAPLLRTVDPYLTPAVSSHK